MADCIVSHQRIDGTKKERSREFRKDMTPEEAELWKQLRGNRLMGLHFQRQQIIAGFIVDFYCHACGLAVEIDGGVHDGQKDYDGNRDEILLRYGIRVLRVANDAVQDDIQGVLDKIADACGRKV
jgi:very-short-patch-repair endonuclease